MFKPGASRIIFQKHKSFYITGRMWFYGLVGWIEERREYDEYHLHTLETIEYSEMEMGFLFFYSISSINQR